MLFFLTYGTEFKLFLMIVLAWNLIRNPVVLYIVFSELG